MNKYVKTIVIVIMQIFISVMLFVAILAIYSANYLLNFWGEIEFATVLYQLNSPLRGTNTDVIQQYLGNALYPAVLVFVIIMVLWLVFAKLSSRLQLKITGYICKRKFSVTLKWIVSLKNRRRIKASIYPVIIIILSMLLVQKAQATGIFTYLADVMDSSTIFEEEYVDPRSVNIQFTEKRNLLYVYMESMETTYADEISGGEKAINYIPNLTKLANENISFSHNNKLGGLFSVHGADWTMGALLGYTSGIPYKLPVEKNSAHDYVNFLPGAYCLGEVLEQNGYKNYFMCGSDGDFGGRKYYFQKHGNYEIFDYYRAAEEGFISEDYHEFWGIEDHKLYQYAKDKLTEIANQEEYFNFTLLTVDTHQPEGYICEICENKYPEQYANSIQCADSQVVEFLNWVKEQDWYENTTVIIAGDHLSMNNTFFDDIALEERRVYNCIINAVPEITNDIKNRIACVLDMYPTTLAAMGAEIEGNRLGLGTNLFSERTTLAEERGIEEFNSQLAKYSAYYDDRLIKNQ